MREKNSNVLLINPWIHDFTAFNLWAKPLGLLYVGSTLQRFGYTVCMVDCLHDYEYSYKQQRYGKRSFFSQKIDKPSLFKDIPRTYKRYGMPYDEFVRKLKCIETPMMLCVTSHMSYWYPGVFETIDIIKAILPSVPVALGGTYATLCHKHAVENSGADYVIEGAGELEVLKLADNLRGKKQDYSHVIEWIGNEMVPAYELYTKLDSVSVITSRGCPYRCSYCASYLFEPKFRLRRPEKVVEEIENYVKSMGIDDIAFFDDALLVDPKRHIIPILEMLIKKEIRTRFHTPNGIHPKYIDRQLARLLRMSGFRTIRMGFEGTSTAVQKASRNKVSCQDLEGALCYLREAEEYSDVYSKDNKSSWDVGVYVLIGMPGQAVKEVVDSIEYINRLGAKIKLTEYSPVPGTDEFQDASRLCPEVITEPLSHNKSTFATVGMGVDYKTFDDVKALTNRLNAGLGSNK
ncbi:MAG: radical SAM protein [Candidatus Brocadiaceae bacterium]|nr:radical SAM protein [Candidatus Brocadiaceae bacterium]